MRLFDEHMNLKSGLMGDIRDLRLATASIRFLYLVFVMTYRANADSFRYVVGKGYHFSNILKLCIGYFGSIPCRNAIHLFLNIASYSKGAAVAQWLSYCVTNQKVAGSIPKGVIGIFH
jgi:hypothetical protein